MEIRDPVHGSIELTPVEGAIVDSPFFQRLREIKQLGFGEYSYPGATHNRYIHSLGVCHLAGEAFDVIFRGFSFKVKQNKWKFRQALRLAALLHDIGHGPLSHTSEECMPLKSELGFPGKGKADHEDYTQKIILDSELTQVIEGNFVDIPPSAVACLLSPTLACDSIFFIDDGLDFRPILSQLVSSELDVDRMDYLVRDSYFCGTDYGKIELEWLISNLNYHLIENKLHLAINRGALYTFDDFLISRHHMYLMVYFHHKAIVFDEMLLKYLTSKDCDYHIPADLSRYVRYTDQHIYEHIKSSKNPWAVRIATRQPYKRLFEIHETQPSADVARIQSELQREGIDLIHSSSIARLSKYHTSLGTEGKHQIFVVDPYNNFQPPYPLEAATDIFRMYEKSRNIERIYVAPEDLDRARKVLTKSLQRT
ncbi:MAG: hydrolase [Bdellovibrionales bacterium CG10_big_fil_rev_8_21_14_0_10_45_34]|nr:MAG: hydrolase [Bdellovibrionales bacterium CG10_big_fil_rev_8_21_14_0_10_45_34]